MPVVLTRNTFTHVIKEYLKLERTLIIIKPDAVQRGLTGEIIRRFEARGLRIAGMKFVQIDRGLAEKHYEIHRGKGFFEGLVSYITSAPVVVIALEGTHAVINARNTIGATRPHEAGAGTIRGDFALEVGRNLVHGSDSVENGEIEIANFFRPEELITWSRSTDAWIFESV
jgi:nucleoside-diphosphate kinase